MYRIREVDGDDEFDALTSLHHRTFADRAPLPDFEEGYWWLATFDGDPVAFLGLVNSIFGPATGYFHRVGVDPSHRGNNLQRRMMRAMEAKARKIGFSKIISDTRNNPHSANNIYAAGFRMFSPTTMWTWHNSQYWKKDL